MSIYNILLTSITICILLLNGSCTKKTSDSPVKQNAFHAASGTADNPGAGMVNVLKKQKLATYQSMTIGNAFDSYSYLPSKEWKQTPLKSGQIAIDFVGWTDPKTLDARAVKDGVTGRGIDVMFVITPDGSYYVFMISRIEIRSDGNVVAQPLDNHADILTKIYANQKINL